ncbi:CcoQ/FixQ family Cbb3-type cytochrome c oxidase assembly chaperone [Flaviaesturariibacter aridisoli]|uniref:CcoQ/FixQ family Cbb3-type cytochrome c oxidase assembly chaperone n=1 Tax=Flaviaesturariibacter aridisoli TaxID=2545761 RepID=A0A4R4EAJ2_9BACT|nr:CcoQ/FixQ family Cbb3-type cytochrome c oxidase assembly chaperone [Flaviaesturariibacter aridisoli]RYY65476.1 MAG: CcoQ/FixQ family Cbb3-type cytochrome c oxidase assembly chaperone [Chitinophagaceae bacterium]TCZ74855.1 CcoQ/FixQ family Cbb3-type cytochrome c oxidase assembly chaperone [Flaviaesturariibacter aridisoli]
MFKFIKKYAETIDHIDIYPIISLLVFFLFFVVMLWFVKRMRKEAVQEISNLPLEDSAQPAPLHF